jgi:hypothetical protein
MKSTIGILTILFFLGCKQFYKAGNEVPSLDITIERNVSYNVIMKYLDSMAQTRAGKYALPGKFKFLMIGGGLEYFPEYNKVAYFPAPPSEVYHLYANGAFLLKAVFNPNRRTDWIIERTVLTDEDYSRIQARLDSLLRDVVEDAKSKGLPDSVIFWQKPFDKITCNLIR